MLHGDGQSACRSLLCDPLTQEAIWLGATGDYFVFSSNFLMPSGNLFLVSFPYLLATYTATFVKVIFALILLKKKMLPYSGFQCG